MSFADNFNRANANPISGSWATCPGQSALKIDTNQVLGSNASGFNGSYYTQLLPADQYVQAKMVSSNGDWSLCARQSSGQNTNYWLVVSNNDWQFGKTVNGTNSYIGSLQSKTIANGTIVKLSVVGTTLTAYFNGIPEAYTQTDADISGGGYAAMSAYGTPPIFDDFECGDVPVPAGFLNRNYFWESY